MYTSGVETTRSGRPYQFGSSRKAAEKAIRILDREGHEQFLATICFYDAE